MKKNNKIISLFALTFLISACSGDKEKALLGEVKPESKPVIYETNPYKKDDQAINTGKKIFEIKCSQCHGPDGGGGPEAPDLTDRVTIYSSKEQDVFKTIYYGTEKGMPTWKDELGSENIWKVMAFLGTFRK
ncbi:MAG: c-type cytochrome [Deltaproteobacteria bacterium]|nr:c-type cytochrome [Deltaproteobacteria bacterium]